MTHPLGVASREVIVHGHHVHTLASQRVQVHRQRGHERLALARTHLGDIALVQGHAAHELDVEVAHLQRALASLAHRGEGFGQKLIERVALGQPSAQLIGLAAQLQVVQLFERRLQCVDLLHRPPVGLQQAVVSTAEQLGQELGQHAAELTEKKLVTLPLPPLVNRVGNHRSRPCVPTLPRGLARLPPETAPGSAERPAAAPRSADEGRWSARCCPPPQ